MVAITLDYAEHDWQRRALSCLAAGAWLMRVPEEKLAPLALLAAENGIALQREDRPDGWWISASGASLAIDDVQRT